MKKLNGIAAVVAFLVTTIFNQVTGQFTTSSPGNVHPSSLKAWFKAEAYNPMNTTPSSLVWYNSATNPGLSSVTTNNAPAKGDLWNYNPTLKFNGTTANQGFRATISNVKDVIGEDMGTMLVIASYNGNGANDQGVCGFRNQKSGKDNEFSILNNEAWIHPQIVTYPLSSGGGNYVGTAINWTNNINTKPSIRASQFLNKDDIGNRKVIFKAYTNSLENDIVNIPHLAAQGNFSNIGTYKMFGIGEIPNLHFFNGSIAEVIVYEKDVSTSERLRMESYVAIKYGITLGSPTTPINYTSSLSLTTPASSQTIWTGSAAFQNNIIGIGRDDISLLNQKQSHQMDDVVRLYLDKIYTTNQENNGTFSKDRSFVLMGSNEDKLHATDASNTEMFAGLAHSTSCHLFSVIERNWKVQRTNMTDRFNIDIRLSDSAKLHQINPAHLRLVVDDDNDLSNGWVGCYGINDDGLNIVYANGEVSFKGISTLHIPNDAIRYITIGSISDGTPLPVGLTEFSSQCDQRKVYLNWTTETETNNDYFTLEKSSDGQHFEPMAFITGQGSKSTATEYNHTDHNALSGISYYRLSQTDYDGTHRVLKTISSNCESDLAITFHPNPTKDGVFISLNGKTEETVEINVFNLFGQHISTHYINGSDWIDLPNTNGIYLMKYTLNGIQSTEKIVKY